MSEKLFETPILFLIFNRPDTTQQVFDQIKQVKPAILYVGADGPREHKEGEAELCQQTRDILQQIDWECELHTFFREKNLGCANAIRYAIDWFFKNEEWGIILEDDCLPNEDFFWFCKMMLEKYCDESNIMMITGDNFISQIEKPNETYYYSRWGNIWGWATWRRAWELYDFQMMGWPKHYTKLIADNYFSDIPEFREHIIYNFDKYFKITEKDTWDFQWSCSVLIHNGLCIIPRENLITNIGDVGVHRSNGDTFALFIPSTSLDLSQIIHPDTITPNKFMDTLAFKYYVRVGTKYYYALKIAGIMRKLKLLPKFERLHPLNVASWFRYQLSK